MRMRMHGQIRVQGSLSEDDCTSYIATMSSSSSGSDWEEGEEVTVPCQCLFCGVVVDGGVQLVLEHCSKRHSFDLNEYVRKTRECLPQTFL